MHLHSELFVCDDETCFYHYRTFYVEVVISVFDMHCPDIMSVFSDTLVAFQLMIPSIDGVDI